MTWFVVTLPDSTTLEFELPDRCKGQHLLDAVCNKLEVIEQDYFGLQYNGPKGEKLWLNRRNKIIRQLTGSQPYRLRFRMKFFVQPHLIVEDNTRHYCFLTCKKDFEENPSLSNHEEAANLNALILRATSGDHFGRHWLLRHAQRLKWSPEFTKTVDELYSKHEQMKAITAEYNCLKIFFSMEGFGYEYHNVKTEDNTVHCVGVGRNGIRFCDESGSVIRRVNYAALNKAWRGNNRSFVLVIINDNGSLQEYDLRLNTPEACIQLFRSVTECHSFFGCETVNSTVKNQFTRDFKEALISFFSEETSEKLYTFDVERTVTEVHDHMRRVIYKEQQQALSDLKELPNTTACDETDIPACTNKQCNDELQQKLQNIHQTFLCKICMDAKIDTVLIPCGHWVCCSTCSHNIEKCPLCRSNITMRQRVYMDLPEIYDHTSSKEVDMAPKEQSFDLHDSQ